MSYEVVIKWVPEDIQALQPDWHESKCEFVLDEISKHLENCVIEYGNEVVGELVSIWIDENEEHGDDDDSEEESL